MPKFVKTFEKSQQTMAVSIAYQDSDGTPNLFVHVAVIGQDGKDLPTKQWSAESLDAYTKVSAGFKAAGFGSAPEETVMDEMGPNGKTITRSEGLEHPELTKLLELEEAGSKVLINAGFEIPEQSVVIAPKETYAAKFKSPEAKPKPIDSKAVRM